MYLFRIYIFIFCRLLPTFRFLSFPLFLQQVPTCSTLKALWVMLSGSIILSCSLFPWSCTDLFLVSSHEAVVKVSVFLWLVWSEHDGFSFYAQPATVKWAAQTQDSERIWEVGTDFKGVDGASCKARECSFCETRGLFSNMRLKTERGVTCWTLRLKFRTSCWIPLYKHTWLVCGKSRVCLSPGASSLF